MRPDRSPRHHFVRRRTQEAWLRRWTLWSVAYVGLRLRMTRVRTVMFRAAFSSPVALGQPQLVACGRCRFRQQHATGSRDPRGAYAMRRDLVATGSLMGVGMLTVASSAIVVPSLLEFAEYFGGGVAGANAANLFLVMPSVGLVAAAPVAGWLADRFGRWHTLLGSRGVVGPQRSQRLLDHSVPVDVDGTVRADGLQHCRDHHQFRFALGGPAGRGQAPEPLGQAVRLHQRGGSDISVLGRTTGRCALAACPS